MPYTNYLDQILNQLIFGNTAYTVPTPLYVGLSTTTPTQSKGGVTPYWNFTEPAGNGYARVSVANNTTNWGPYTTQPSTGQEQANLVAITFPAATGNWGTVTYLGVFDALTAGNLLAYGALTIAQTIGNGATPSFAAQQLTSTLN